MSKRLPLGDSRHGSLAGYALCRCEACRNAQRQARREKKALLAVSPEKFTHGLRNTYNLGCRCTPCSDKHRDDHYRNTYGITQADYDEMLTAQGGMCACCGGPPNGAGNRLYVDHDHGTRHVRGLLCFSCNSGIGALGDTIEGLRRALDYLERSQA